MPQENIDSWVDICTVIPEVVNMGNYWEMCRLHHKCTILIERYTGDSRLITAYISAWINDYDNDRDDYQMPNPDIDIEALDASGTQWDVDITIEFMESVLVVQDDEGDITWKDERWSLIEDPLIDYAESVDGVEPEEITQNVENVEVGHESTACHEHQI